MSTNRALENSPKLFKYGKNGKKGGKMAKDIRRKKTYLPPVAKSVFEGLISMAWIPHSASGGLLFSLLASEGM